eukprot:TRINITY_DN4585_c0_g1_i3.p1 TRINITY_DN4585_c0_g1~~TRINITY_DN4585_c0_g1_i3.p1  ORF type:complete len:352 (+),score=36.27 TRINITY_DN4585_c0_g1_i3:50-1057(+)
MASSDKENEPPQSSDMIEDIVRDSQCLDKVICPMTLKLKSLDSQPLQSLRRKLQFSSGFFSARNLDNSHHDDSLFNSRLRLSQSASILDGLLRRKPQPDTTAMQSWNNFPKPEFTTDSQSPFKEGTRTLLIPYYYNGAHPDLNYINPQTLVRLIDGDFVGVEKYFIYDCRYPYEYNGGHIRGAINVLDHESHLRDKFLRSPGKNQGIIIVFHCEYSSKRAPEVYRYFRNMDRMLNNYPNLFYENVFILEGGYKNFFDNYQDYCIPQNYVTMRNKEYREECRHFNNQRKKMKVYPAKKELKKENVTLKRTMYRSKIKRGASAISLHQMSKHGSLGN